MCYWNYAVVSLYAILVYALYSVQILVLLLTSQMATNSQESEAPLVLRFSPAADADEFRQVQAVLAASPGTRPVRLMFCRPDGESLQMDAGINLRVTMTPELRDKLAPWLEPEGRQPAG